MSRALSVRVRLFLRLLKQWVPGWLWRRPFLITALVAVTLLLGVAGAFVWQNRIYFRPEACNSMAFSPEGDALAIGYADGVTRLITFHKDGSRTARLLKESAANAGITTKYTPYIYPAKLWGGWRPAYIMNEEQPSPDGSILARKGLDGNWLLQPVYQRLAAAGAGALPVVVDSTTPSAITIAGGQGGSELHTGIPGFGVRWRPDGTQLAILQAIIEPAAEDPKASPSSTAPTNAPTVTSTPVSKPSSTPPPSNKSASIPHPPAGRYGPQVAVAKALRVTIWDVAARRVVATYELPCTYTESIVWSRDGKMLGTAELTRRDPLIAANKIAYRLTWWDAVTGRRLSGTTVSVPPNLNSMLTGTRPARNETIAFTSEIRDIAWSPALDRVAVGINITPLNIPSRGIYGLFSQIRIIPMPAEGTGSESSEKAK